MTRWTAHALVAVCCCLVLAAGAPASTAAETGPQMLDLITDGSAWSGAPDHPTTQQTVTVRDGTLVTDITGNGDKEDYPKLTRIYDAPQDWRRFARIRTRVRVTCDDPEVRQKNLRIVLLDEHNRRADLPDHPMTQQCFGHTVPVGRWVELKNWLDGIDRSAIRQVDLYLYEVPPEKAHHYRWEIASLQLESLEGAFDSEIWPGEALKGVQSAPAARLATRDGLRLALGQQGDISLLTVGGKRVGASDPAAPSGLLVRDVAANGAPVVVGGKIRRQGSAVRQTARLDALDLAVDATYRVVGNALEIRGTVADLRGADRAVTVYFAVPVAEAPWEWWHSAAVARTAPGHGGELAYYESGMEYGHGGRHSKYPLGAITWPGQAGLSLAIRMDEPVVHRIFYNPRLRLFTVALDFGLVPMPRLRGRPLSEAPFRVLLYRHDPAWGFRSALQRYYDLFPQFFTRRVQREGGWYVWGNVKDTPGAVEAGFGFHWGPANEEAVRWDNENGLLAVYYIEAEFHQQTMGDYDRAPTVDEVMDRLRKLADADPETTAAVEKLSYGYARSGREFLQAVSQATFASAFHDSNGQAPCMIAQMPWIGESNWGAILPCNLDPDIPQGKGWFNFQFMLRQMLANWGSKNARYDGIALDSFGGYGQLGRASYRREHFPYADFPLSFSAVDQKPVQVAAFASLEWLRALAREVHGRRKVLMANCSWNITPGWLTFAAPYLDIFGAEWARFADPDFIRAIAYRKPCTDLPYEPQPEWDACSRLLHGIYQGHGHDMAVMRRCIGPLRQLSAAGWQPVSGARVLPATLRLERYGSGKQVLLALHNLDNADRQAEVNLVPSTLGWPANASVKATLIFPTDGRTVQVSGRNLSLPLAGRETVVLSVTR